MKDFYVTTPIFYVNSSPHLGHAYTVIISDIIVRVARLLGYNTKFSTGTDEYGKKVELSSIKNNIPVKEFVDKNSSLFKDLIQKCDISDCDFVRTTENRHKIAVQHFIKNMWDKGYLYAGKYAGWYSVGDEAFFKEAELTEDKKTPTGHEVEWIEEETIFFALSKFQKPLLDFYEKNPNFVTPKSIQKEIVNFVSSGLEDLSVSRTDFTWGICMPLDDERKYKKQHIVYVWLDALVNYLSCIGYPDISKYKQYWPANWHIIGKDILRFHGIYWPAFLMANDILPPKKLAVHGWWMKDGNKMSKSLGNIVDPMQLIKDFDADFLRFFCVREMRFGQDGNFTLKNFKERVNTELINKIGNFVQRTIKLNAKICNNRVPKISDSKIQDIYNLPIMQYGISIKDKFDKILDDFDYTSVLNEILELSDQANKFLDTNKPWSEKDKTKQLFCLYTCLEIIRYIGVYMQPFIPKHACKILNILNIRCEDRKLSSLSIKFCLKENPIQKVEKIFQKCE